METRVIYLVALFFLSLATPSYSEQLEVGASCIDVNPKVFPIQLRSGKSNYVHDPLHVRAVAFQRGEGRAVICLIDAIGIGRDMSDLAKARAAEKTGWKPEEMLICATHTHTAPKGGEGTPGKEAYEKLKHEKLEEAIVKAIQSLQPARVGFGSDEEPSEVRNRRWFLQPGTMPPNPLGEKDQVKTNANRNHLVKLYQMVTIGIGLDLVFFTQGVRWHSAGLEEPSPVAHFARLLVGTEADPCRLQGLNGFHDGFLELLVLELFVGLLARRSFAAFGGGVGVGGANQHFFGLPTGLFCGPCLGEVGHVPADSDGVDQADDGPSFTSLECHRPHMEGVMHIIGFA